MNFKLRLRVENLTLEGEIMLPDQDQQRVISHLHAAGLFGGKPDVRAIISLLRAIVDALDSFAGGQTGQAGGEQVSGGPGPSATRP